MIIAVDFDGTLIDHQFPDIGKEVPGAFAWLRKFQEEGAGLILWTCRCDGDEYGPTLTQAVEFCRERGIEFVDVNCNTSASQWMRSPKIYADIYIDDKALGCPLRSNPRSGGAPFVDWDVVGYEVYQMLRRKAA